MARKVILKEDKQNIFENIMTKIKDVGMRWSDTGHMW